MTFSEKIEDFVINTCGLSQEDVDDFENDGMWLSNAIIKYAYGRRKRRNGDLYIYHFGRCLSEYTRFVGIMQDIPCSVAISLLEEKGIPSPYAGIEETLLLHDIIKDTDVTLDDLQEIFYRYGWQNTFDKTIGKALPILNDTSCSTYDEYFDKINDDKIAAFVKMFDFHDKISLLNYDSVDDETVKYVMRCIEYFKKINDKWHFLEKICDYFDTAEKNMK